MVASIRFGALVFFAASGAGIGAAAVTLLAAAIGWLLGFPLVGGSLAMFVSAMLIMGFGGLSARATVLVGLSWGFADRLLGDLGIAGMAGRVTMAVAYFILGLTAGKTRDELLSIGMGPMLGLSLGTVLGAWVFPHQVVQGLEEAVLSAAAIAAARAARARAEDLNLEGPPERPAGTVAELLAELGGRREEGAVRELSSRPDALPLVADACDREPNAKRRRTLIQCLRRYGDMAALSALRKALRDPDERVWKEALEGLMDLAGGAVERALEEERAALSQDARARVKREWIDEALEQLKGAA